MPLYLSRFSYTPETWANLIGSAVPALKRMSLPSSAASARASSRAARSHDGHAVPAGRGGAVGGLVVHDDDLGEVRIAGERRELAGAKDQDAASARGA